MQSEKKTTSRVSLHWWNEAQHSIPAFSNEGPQSPTFDAWAKQFTPTFSRGQSRVSTEEFPLVHWIMIVLKMSLLWFHESSTIGGNINGNKTSWVYNPSELAKRQGHLTYHVLNEKNRSSNSNPYSPLVGGFKIGEIIEVPSGNLT